MLERPSIKANSLLTKHDLERAIEAFDRRDKSKELLDTFIKLIDAGFSEANYFVGCMYEDGTNGVTRNLEYAYFYYKQSVDTHGYLEGYLSLARMHYHAIGVPQDFTLARKYYAHVAQATKNPIACFMLGRMYQYGQGVQKDLAEARRWYAEAITRGSVYGMINMAMLEAEEGNVFRSLFLRVQAGLRAFLISRKNPRDARLRGG